MRTGAPRGGGAGDPSVLIPGPFAHEGRHRTFQCLAGGPIRASLGAISFPPGRDIVRLTIRAWRRRPVGTPEHLIARFLPRGSNRVAVGTPLHSLIKE